MSIDGENEGEPPQREQSTSDRIEEIAAAYADRLIAGEKIEPQEILSAHPTLGQGILEHLELFVGLGRSEGDVPLGTLGDYTLRRQVGRGGMGVVYDAWENSMDRRVALKVLPAGVAADTRASARFQREAQAAGKLHHQNIVGVYSTGVREGTPWYAMEFVEGETLAQILARLRATEKKEEERKSVLQSVSTIFRKGSQQVAALEEKVVEEAEHAKQRTVFGSDDVDLRYHVNLAHAFAGVAEGLQHAHSKRIIHRDVKPSNLILDRGGRLRILDFGVARLEGQESLTVSGEFVGTPLYMSPEQARARITPIDHRTDIYSLGATMYEMLTWRPPFKGKNHRDTLSQIIEWDPVEPRKLNSRVPKDLETIVLKCLQKDPGDRYGTAEALAQDLRRCVRGDPIEARPQSRMEALLRRLWRRRWTVAACASLFVLLLITGLLAYFYLKARHEERTARYNEQVQRATLEVHRLSLMAQEGSGDMDFVERGITRTFKHYFPTFNRQSHEKPVSDLLDLLTEAIQLCPDRAEAYYYKARALALLGQGQEALLREHQALIEISRALERDADFVPAYALRRTLHGRQGDAEGGEKAREDLHRHLEGTWQWQWVNAHEAMEKWHWDAAARAFDRLQARYKKEGEPYVGAAIETSLQEGKACLGAGDYFSAIENLSTARDLWPAAAAPALLLGKAWCLLGTKQSAQGALEHADAVFMDLYRASGEREETALMIAEIYYRLNCCEDFLRWIAKIPHEGFWKACKADTLERRQKHVEAEHLAREVLKLDPTLLLAYSVLGRSLSWQGRDEEAVHVWRDALVQDPDCVRILWRYGSALWRLGKRKEGIAHMRRAVQLDPHDAAAATWLGRHLFRQRDYEEAERLFLQVLDRLPRFHLAQAFLAQVYIKRGEYEKAIETAKLAVRFGPRNHYAHRNLGMAYLKRGQLRESIVSFSNASRVFYNSSTCRLQTARYHDALNRRLSWEPRLECTDELQRLIDAIEEGLRARQGQIPFKFRVPAIETLALASLHVRTPESLSVAVEFLRGSVQEDQRRDPDMLVLMAKVLFLQGHGSEAIRLIEEAARLPQRARRRWSWFLVGTLNRYRQAALPELPSYDTVDALLYGRHMEVLVSGDARWRFFPGREEPSEQPLAWTRVGFEDGSWREGPGGFGYGDGDDVTVLDDMRSNYTSVCIRTTFTVDDPGRYDRLRLWVYADDGFLAYLNGNYIAAFQVDIPEGSAVPWVPTDSVAFLRMEKPPWPILFSIDPKLLKPGENVLALQGFNESLESDSFSLIPILRAILPIDPLRDQQLLAECEEAPQPGDSAGCLAYLRGRVHERAGRFAEATTEYREALRDREPKPFLRLAHTLRSCENPESAEKVLRSAFTKGLTTNRALWELWITISLVDLGRDPNEVLADSPLGQISKTQAPQMASSYAEDLRWLLEQLQNGETIRINCGGGDYAGTDGKRWSRDRFSQGGWKDGSRKSRMDIANTEDDRLYLTGCKFSVSPDHRLYRIPLPPAAYRIILHFAEVDVRPGSTIERKFTVMVEGKRILEDYRPKVREAEYKTTDTGVDDGMLDIDFISQCARPPRVCAIEVRKVN